MGSMTRKRICRIAAAAAAVLMAALPAAAAGPYENYTYDQTGEMWAEPQAYYAERIVLGSELGVGAFSGPGDVFVAPDGRVFIADTGNDRIVILKKDLSAERVLDGFTYAGKKEKFASPQGVFVTADGALYVADTDNGRIVEMDKNGEAVRIIGEPDFDVDNKFDYKPIRVSVDTAGRIFVVSKNVNYGMIELDKDGAFSSFYGAVKVSSSLTDSLWRKIATEIQRERMLQNVPTEYSSNAIDGDGFLYGTIATKTADYHVCRLNALGNDVLRRNGAVAPEGDVAALDEDGKEVTSTLVDICVGQNGVYSVLDSTRGRVFTYDQNGDLLFVFGALGDRMGCVTQPSALDMTADMRFIVADSGADKLVVYAPTEYAKKITEAVRLQYERDFAGAEKLWIEMLRYSSNSGSAYREIGKAFYRQGDYTAAMKYFKLAGDQDRYSDVFKQYRRTFMNARFDTFMNILVIAAAAAAVTWLTVRILRRRSGKKKRGEQA